MADVKTQKITPFLWFDKEAEEAANFYVSVFRDGSLGEISRYGEAGPGPAGSAMVVPFEIVGMTFLALNAGPIFKFTEAISFVINCDDQAEVDYFWESLTADGGQPGQCGWLKDRFGLSWQVVPKVLAQLVAGPDKAGAGRAMGAMMQMTKFDIGKLQAAYDG